MASRLNSLMDFETRKFVASGQSPRPCSNGLANHSWAAYP
jgi:hypothetical protein